MWEPGEEDEVATAGEDGTRVAPETRDAREARETRETRAREELAAVTRESSTAQDSGISSTSDSTVSYSAASRGQGQEDLSTVPWYEAEMPRWVRGREAAVISASIFRTAAAPGAAIA